MKKGCKHSLVGSLLSGISIAARTNSQPHHLRPRISGVDFAPSSTSARLSLRSLTCAGLVTVSSAQTSESPCGLNTTAKAFCTTYLTQRAAKGHRPNVSHPSPRNTATEKSLPKARPPITVTQSPASTCHITSLFVTSTSSKEAFILGLKHPGRV